MGGAKYAAVKENEERKKISSREGNDRPIAIAKRTHSVYQFIENSLRFDILYSNS